MSDTFQSVNALELRVLGPDGTQVGTFTGDDSVIDMSVSSGAGQTIGSGSVTILADSNDADAIQMGHRLDVYLDTSGSLDLFGSTRIGDYDITTKPGPGPTEVSAELHNYVFSLLRDRQFTGRVSDESARAALERVVNREVPEVNVRQNFLSNGAGPSEPVTRTYSSTRVLDLVGDLAPSSLLIGADGTDLLMFPLPDSPGPTLGPDDVSAPSLKISGEPTTRLRVEGGDIDVPAGPSQPNGPLTKPLAEDGEPVIYTTHLSPTDAGQISRLDLETSHPETDGKLIARLHPDDDGSPVAPGEQTAAIVAKSLDATFVSPDGTTTIEFPDHSFTGDPWLVVTQERPDANTAPISVAGEERIDDFTPKVMDVKSPLPLSLIVSDDDATAEYGRRDGTVQRDSVSSFGELSNVAESELERRSSPREELTFEARSSTARSVSLLEAVTVDLPSLFDSPRPFIVTEASHVIENSRVKTELTLTQPKGFDPTT